MWLGDNCHTLDRANFKAQLECGIGLNYDILDQSTKRAFEIAHYPNVQSEENYKCLESLKPDSNINIFSHAVHLLVALNALIFYYI